MGNYICYSIVTSCKAVILEGDMSMEWDEVNRQANHILQRLEREYARDLQSEDGLI